MSKTLKDIVTDFQDTGACGVDVDLVVEKWNHTWGVFQWEDTYRLIKFQRMGTENTRIKVGISTEQAKEIIDKLGLTGGSGGFKSATTWRQWDKFYEKLAEFNAKRK